MNMQLILKEETFSRFLVQWRKKLENALFDRGKLKIAFEKFFGIKEENWSNKARKLAEILFSAGKDGHLDEELSKLKHDFRATLQETEISHPSTPKGETLVNLSEIKKIAEALKETYMTYATFSKSSRFYAMKNKINEVFENPSGKQIFAIYRATKDALNGKFESDFYSLISNMM